MDVRNKNVKYWVICNDEIVRKGTTEYYSDVIPDGYEYVWGCRTPGGIFVNVVPGAEMVARTEEVKNCL